MSTAPSPVILATAGYDHTIRLWDATSANCYRTIQYADSVGVLLFVVFLMLCCEDGGEMERGKTPIENKYFSLSPSFSPLPPSLSSLFSLSPVSPLHSLSLFSLSPSPFSLSPLSYTYFSLSTSFTASELPRHFS